MSHQTLRVLLVFIGSEEAISGADITRNLEILSGTIYPILVRLEKAGWLKSRWEKIDPGKAGRPRKRLYVLTNKGRKETRRTFAELSISLPELGSH